MTDEELGRAEAERLGVEPATRSDGRLWWSDLHDVYAIGVDCDVYSEIGQAYSALGKKCREVRAACGYDEAVRMLTQERDAARAERDELLASHQKVVGEHNGLVLAGDSLLAKAGQYRVERDAAVERAVKAEKERDARPAYIYCHPCGYQSRSMVCTKHGGMCNQKFQELMAERDAALAKCRELEAARDLIVRATTLVPFACDVPCKELEAETWRSDAKQFLGIK